MAYFDVIFRKGFISYTYSNALLYFVKAQLNGSRCLFPFFAFHQVDLVSFYFRLSWSNIHQHTVVQYFSILYSSKVFILLFIFYSLWFCLYGILLYVYHQLFHYYVFQVITFQITLNTVAKAYILAQFAYKVGFVFFVFNSFSFCRLLTYSVYRHNKCCYSSKYGT